MRKARERMEKIEFAKREVQRKQELYYRYIDNWDFITCEQQERLSIEESKADSVKKAHEASKSP